MVPSLVALALAVAGCTDRADPPRKPAGGPAPTTSGAAAAPPARLVPLPDTAGEIRHVVIHCKQGQIRTAALTLHQLLGALSPDTRVSFICDGEAAGREMNGRVKQYGLAGRENVRIFILPGPLSMWARDRYIVNRPIVPGGPMIWLMPAVPRTIDEAARANEHNVVLACRDSWGGLDAGRTPLVLEGGNLIATRRHIFIGANVFRENAPMRAPGRTRQSLEATFALPIVFVADASGEPPFLHVDMYLTAISDDGLLVADATWGARLAGQLDQTGRERLRKLLLDRPPTDEARARRFDEVASRLEAEGFHVGRLPYLDSENGAFMVTYHNVLQEWRHDRHVVYMPVYGVGPVDDAAERVYRQAGCEVRRIDVSPIAHLCGFLRCMVNVVERSDGAQPPPAVSPPSARPRPADGA